MRSGLLFLWGALLVACRDGGEETGAELAAVGYAVSVEGFHRAAELGDLEVLRKMLEGGVDLQARLEGESALHAAAAAGREDSLAFLLERGMAINTAGAGGRTALMRAAQEDRGEAVVFLLRQGADVEVRDESGYRALTLAAEAGHTGVVEVLAPVSREYLDDALFLAALRGHAATVDALAQFGASVYARMEDGRTALMMAAREGRAEVVRVLLDHGANRYAVDLEGLTAGQIAMAAGELELGQALSAAPGEGAFALPELPELADVEMIEMNIAGEEPAEEVVVAGESSPRPSGAPVAAAGSGEEPRPGEGPEALLTALRPPREPSPDVPMVMKEYRERPLPLRIEGVAGEEVRVRYLFGGNERVTVRRGEEIPFTGLRVVSVEARRKQTKESGEGWADVSAVVVEDPRSGQRRQLITRLAASAHEPFAVMAGRDGTNQVARRGGLVQSADGERYRVLDVRPTQVVIERLSDGKVATVMLDRRG